jgi:hypothetical protein
MLQFIGLPVGPILGRLADSSPIVCHHDGEEQSLPCLLERRNTCSGHFFGPVAHDRGESRETVPLQVTLVILSGCEGKSELWPSRTQVWLLASSPAVLESCGLMARG